MCKASHCGGTGSADPPIPEALHDELNGLDDVLPLEADLRMGEPQRGKPRGGVRLISKAIPRLLGRRAVIAQAVGLDHKSEVGPEEIDLEAIEHQAGLGERQTDA